MALMVVAIDPVETTSVRPPDHVRCEKDGVSDREVYAHTHEIVATPIVAMISFFI